MNKSSLTQRSVYAFGIAGQNVLYNFMAMYIMFFFTDLLGIPSETATAIVVIATLWDAVNDPVMGLIVDKTKTKLGKFRPYLLGGAPLMFISTVLCFTYFGTEPAVTIAIAAVTYIAWGMSYTVSDIPLWAISSVVSDDTQEKNTMITVGKVAATLGAVICVLFSVTILDLFGGTREITAYFYTAILIGGISAIGIFAIGFFIKERVAVTQKKIAIKENIKTITKNRSLMLLLVSLFAINFINGIRQAGQIYFTTYTWGDEGYVTAIGAALVIGMVGGMLATPKLMQKFEKRNILIVSAIAGAVVNFLPYFSLQNVVLGLIAMGLSFASVGVMTLAGMSMLLDAIDYSEVLLGFRGEGIVFSLNTFVTKLSAAFARLILGVCLVLMNYVENQPVTNTTITWFSALVYIAPTVASVAVAAVIYRYDINKQSELNTQKLLKERRGE